MPGGCLAAAADPYLDPKAANIAPAGTRITANNPYEPGWHTLELPEDPHLTDQWPFFATGVGRRVRFVCVCSRASSSMTGSVLTLDMTSEYQQRYPGYLDVRTTQGQKAASGGVGALMSLFPCGDVIAEITKLLA